MTNHISVKLDILCIKGFYKDLLESLCLFLAIHSCKLLGVNELRLDNILCKTLHRSVVMPMYKYAGLYFSEQHIGVTDQGTTFVT